MAVPYTSPPDSPKDPTTKKPFQATVEDASDVDLAKPIHHESNDQDSQKHEQNTSAPRSSKQQLYSMLIGTASY